MIPSIVNDPGCSVTINLETQSGRSRRALLQIFWCSSLLRAESAKSRAVRAMSTCVLNVLNPVVDYLHCILKRVGEGEYSVFLFVLVASGHHWEVCLHRLCSLCQVFTCLLSSPYLCLLQTCCGTIPLLTQVSNKSIQ